MRLDAKTVAALDLAGKRVRNLLRRGAPRLRRPTARQRGSRAPVVDRPVPRRRADTSCANRFDREGGAPGRAQGSAEGAGRSRARWRSAGYQGGGAPGGGPHRPVGDRQLSRSPPARASPGLTPDRAALPDWFLLPAAALAGRRRRDSHRRCRCRSRHRRQAQHRNRRGGAALSLRLLRLGGRRGPAGQRRQSSRRFFFSRRARRPRPRAR